MIRQFVTGTLEAIVSSFKVGCFLAVVAGANKIDSVKDNLGQLFSEISSKVAKESWDEIGQQFLETMVRYVFGNDTVKSITDKHVELTDAYLDTDKQVNQTLSIVKLSTTAGVFTILMHTGYDLYRKYSRKNVMFFQPKQNRIDYKCLIKGSLTVEEFDTLVFVMNAHHCGYLLIDNTEKTFLFYNPKHINGSLYFLKCDYTDIKTRLNFDVEFQALTFNPNKEIEVVDVVGKVKFAATCGFFNVDLHNLFEEIKEGDTKHHFHYILTQQHAFFSNIKFASYQVMKQNDKFCAVQMLLKCNFNMVSIMEALLCCIPQQDWHAFFTNGSVSGTQLFDVVEFLNKRFGRTVMLGTRNRTKVVPTSYPNFDDIVLVDDPPKPEDQVSRPNSFTEKTMINIYDHQSNFDDIILMNVHKQMLSYIPKAEVSDYQLSFYALTLFDFHNVSFHACSPTEGYL